MRCPMGCASDATHAAAFTVCQQFNLTHAPVWALVVALSWAIGWMITRAVGIDLALQWSVFGSSGALMFQLLTGLTLAWLLQGRKVTPVPQARLEA
jgi:hypothetical protein